jgi:cobalt/nickel transport system permease protein
LLVSSFALFVGIFNPLFDRQTLIVLEGVQVSAGWLSFLSILLKFLLTISAALLLVATTSFPGVCRALGKLGMPSVFTSQLVFLYRYLFVLIEEAMRAVRARDLRSFGGRGLGIKTFVRLVGTLFIRTVERAERIHLAMLCRGFRGEFIAVRQQTFKGMDALFLALTIFFLYICRMHDPVILIGRLFQGAMTKS